MDENLGVVIEDKEVNYWKKALLESEVMLEKLKSSLKYEEAVNEMCKAKLQGAELNAQADMLANGV